jgi:hypothetical protein
MAASNRKIIVVVGATGNQGSSVARTFLSLSSWKVRATTRNPSSPAAQALAARGAEVVQADLSDLSSLSKAFQDAHAIFLNTDFWGTYRSLVVAMMANKANINEGQPEPSKVAWQTEISHGKNAAEAAAKVLTLERLVYSALPAVKNLTGGKYQSHHADSKGAIVDYIENELPDLAKKTSLIYLGAYNTNALLAPKLDPSDGKYKCFGPMGFKATRMPIIDPKESTGPFVRALIEDEQPGIKLLAYDTDSYLSMPEICDVWSRASGKEASVVEVTLEIIHQKLGVPMEVLQGLPAYVEFGYTGSMKVIEPGELTTKVRTKSYEEWMKGRDWKAILEVD